MIAARTVNDIVAQAQAVIDQEQANLIRVTVALARILILTMSLVFKLGTQYHMGLVMIQFWPRPYGNHQLIKSQTDDETVEMVTVIPTHVIWNWIPSMCWITRLKFVGADTPMNEGAALWRAAAQRLQETKVVHARSAVWQSVEFPFVAHVNRSLISWNLCNRTLNVDGHC